MTGQSRIAEAVRAMGRMLGGLLCTKEIKRGLSYWFVLLAGKLGVVGRVVFKILIKGAKGVKG